MSLSLDECCKVLGLAPGVTPDEVRQAYKDLVNVWHPDRFSHDAHLQQKAQEELKKINEAYKILEDSFSNGPRPAPHAAPPPTPTPAPQQPAPAPVVPAAIQHSSVSSWMWPLTAIFIAIIFYFAISQEPAPVPVRNTPVEPYNVPITNEKVKLPPVAPSNEMATALSPEAIAARKNQEAQKWGGTIDSKYVDSSPSVSPNLSYITVGSTKSDVMRIEGQPDSASSNLLTYGSSHIYLEDGRVSGWENRSPRLKVKLKPSVRSRENTFTVGSTKDAVLSVQGTPDSFSDNEFTYGTSTVHFEDGHVTSWFDHEPPLKIRMQPGKE